MLDFVAAGGGTAEASRGSDTRLRQWFPSVVAIAVAPPRRPSDRSGRAASQTSQRRKLSSEQRAEIRSNAGNRTLRELAHAFGVSHETIRTVLRERDAAVVR